MPQQHAPKLPHDMKSVLPREVLHVLHCVGGQFARRPAREVALWLACIPLVLPSPLVAGSIAVSARLKGDRDPRWWLIMALSMVNFFLSALALVWISTFFGNWMVDRLNDLLGPLFIWPADRGPISIPV